MDRIKKLKIKKQDGTFSDYIPIGADAENIDFENGYSLDEIVGDINPDEDGTLEVQLTELYNSSPLNILNYGARPNDENFDNSIAIQNAIDDGIRLNKPIYIPIGNFYISKPLKIYGSGGDFKNKTIIRGELKNLSIITKNTNNKLNNEKDYDEDAIFLLCNSSAIDDSEYVTGNDASGFYIDNLSLTGTTTIKPKYGIYAAHVISTAGMNIKDMYINYCEEACLCLKGSTYLSRIENVRVDRAHYGMYIHDGTNTSLNIVNCYAMGDQIGYYVGGIYMTMNCCCGDWCTEKVFDLQNYHGSLISPGSESTGADYCFYFRASDVTVTGAYTFGNFTEENAAHIYVGWSNVQFIGGVLMVSNSVTKKTAPGYFVQRTTLGDINFINTVLDGYYTKGKGSTGEPSEVQTYSSHGNMNYRYGQGTPYIGRDKYEEEDLDIIKQNKYLQGNAIFFNNGLWSNKSVSEDNKGHYWEHRTLPGDTLLYGQPARTGLWGAVQTLATGSYYSSGKYLEIPCLVAGTTANRIKHPAQGMCYFDTTLNKPIWCKTAGKLNSVKLYFDNYTPLTEDKELNISINGNEKALTIPAGTTTKQLTDMIWKLWYNTASEYDFYVGNERESRIYIYSAYSTLTLTVSLTIDGQDASSILGMTMTNEPSTQDPIWVDATGTEV